MTSEHVLYHKTGWELLRLAATPETIDYGAPRECSATTVRQLAQGLWVGPHQIVLVTGPTGIGKTFVLCAFGYAASRRNLPVRYVRAPVGERPDYHTRRDVVSMTPQTPAVSLLNLRRMGPAFPERGGKPGPLGNHR